ncbi:MAG: type II toxin-antitoxin system RelE/ParE family toxin [Gammaproteobacteria bacterium]|nr:type II toxin-antitoxin system RelE/ParE family toxin [Gammaproteobacteria bacterium]
MAEVNWTLEAQKWLEDIFEHIAEDNPRAAGDVVAGIYERSQVLIDHPEIGYRYQSSSRRIRILLYGHYRIAYLIKDSGDIDILGVFHGALDITKYSL